VTTQRPYRNDLVANDRAVIPFKRQLFVDPLRFPLFGTLPQAVSPGSGGRKRQSPRQTNTVRHLLPGAFRIATLSATRTGEVMGTPEERRQQEVLAGEDLSEKFD
jgi:hypothetical protein